MLCCTRDFFETSLYDKHLFSLPTTTVIQQTYAYSSNATKLAIIIRVLTSDLTSLSSLSFIRRRCKAKDICGHEIIREVAYCYTEGSFCQTWIDGQVKKNTVENRANYYQTATAVRPHALHKDPIPANPNRRESNSISNDYYSYYGKTTKSPESTPQTFSCGFPMVRNKPKNYLWGMLRIIGGKTARKGQWPWQVVILNRFKVNKYLHMVGESLFYGN